MKFGIRTPSIKKSFKARTTGKLKRELKKSINPYYGKSGVGLIKDPKKSVYNKVYNHTSVDSLKDIKRNNNSSKDVKRDDKSFIKIKESRKMEKQNSYFDGGLAQLVGYRILGFFVTICTLGICLPWHFAWFITGKSNTPSLRVKGWDLTGLQFSFLATGLSGFCLLL